MTAGIRWFPLIAVALMTGAGCSRDTGKGKPAPEEDGGREDMQKLQGKWLVTEYIHLSRGRASDEDLKDLTLEFQADRLTFRIDKDDSAKVLKYTLNPTKKPKWIDLDGKDESGKGKSTGPVEGIYELDGEELTLCLKGEREDEKAAPRPSRFKHKFGSYSLFVLKRAGSADKPADPEQPSGEGKPSPEELFRSMESQLARAKTVRCEFSTDLDFKGDERTAGAGGQLEGTLALAQGNKVRLTIQDGEGLLGPRQGLGKGEIVSNGVRMSDNIHKVPRDRSPADTPARLTEFLAALLSRVGLYQGFLREKVVHQLAGTEQEFKPDRAFPVSDFKYAGKSKVGGRPAHVITHQLDAQAFEDFKDRPVQVKVWIDVETKLPLKRELSADGGVFRITETYEGMKLDEQVDARRFELP